jgi:hypothetical protein
MTLRAGVAKLAGAALAGSLLMIVAAAPATAKLCYPHHSGGNAEVNQYLETIPGPCGNQTIGDNGSGNQGTSTGTGAGSGSSAAGLPPGTISQLESMGPAGAQAAGFAEATNPGGSAGGGKSGSAGGGSGASGSSGNGATSDDGSLLSALEKLVTGNDANASGTGQGLGTWLPILLGMVLIGGLGAVALRRGRIG